MHRHLLHSSTAADAPGRESGRRAEPAAPCTRETRRRHAPTSAAPRATARSAPPPTAGRAPDAGDLVDLVDLAHRAGRGDTGALERFVAALAAPVRRLLAVRIAGQPDDVLDDCAQEALARIAGAARAARAPGGHRYPEGDHDGGGAHGRLTGECVVAWALTVARRAALNHLRSPASGAFLRARGVALVDTSPFDTGGDASHEAIEAARGGASRGGGREHVGAQAGAGAVAPEPDELSPARRTVCAIAVAAQAALPPHGAELVWARLIAGASWEDLAAQLGTTAGAAKGRYLRALRILRRTCLRAIDALPAPECAAARAHLRLAAPPG